MKRYYYMDVLNIFATFAVVMLHSTGYAFWNVGNAPWREAVVLQVLFIFAVPVFFMISGANLLDYRLKEDSRTFFKKRLHRIAIPFIFWTIIWFVYQNVQEWHHPWSNWHTYARLFNGLMHNSVQPIFWFFYIIIGFYLSAPLLTKIFTVENKALVQYLIVLNLIINGFISYYYQVKQQDDFALIGGFSIGLSGSIVFFAIGWYLKHFPLTKRQTQLLTIAGLVSVVIMIVATIVLSNRRGEYQHQVYTIWGIFGITWSVAVYNLFQRSLANFQPKPYVARLLKNMAGASLGVYVIHDFFIDMISRQGLFKNGSPEQFYGMPVLVWIVSLLLVLFIKKIPLLKETV